MLSFSLSAAMELMRCSLVIISIRWSLLSKKSPLIAEAEPCWEQHWIFKQFSFIFLKKILWPHKQPEKVYHLLLQNNVLLTSLSLRAKKPSVCVLVDTLARSVRGTLAFSCPVFWSARTTFFLVNRKSRGDPCKHRNTGVILHSVQHKIQDVRL